MKIRAFVAIKMSAEVRTNAARVMERLASQSPDVKWVSPENLHITLKFFGDIPIEATHEISRALEGVCVGRRPLEILIAGVGAFPDIRRPRTLWLGVQDGHDGLVKLAGELEDLFAEMRYPRERRRFQPHLTIGRVRGGSRPPERAKGGGRPARGNGWHDNDGGSDRDGGPSRAPVSPELIEQLEQLQDSYIGQTRVVEILLMSSVLERSGPVYSRISTIDLGE